jgi:hypothetical protein
MKTAFNWRSEPSALGQEFPKNLPKVDLAPKRYHEYSAATISDKTREAEIAQVNREVEYHFGLAQKITDDVMRGYHRDEARRLAAKVRALVQGRSEAFVAQMEEARGLS